MSLVLHHRLRPRGLEAQVQLQRQAEAFLVRSSRRRHQLVVAFFRALRRHPAPIPSEVHLQAVFQLLVLVAAYLLRLHQHLLRSASVHQHRQLLLVGLGLLPRQQHLCLEVAPVFLNSSINNSSKFLHKLPCKHIWTLRLVKKLNGFGRL